MAKTSINYFGQILKVFAAIHKEHPTYSFGNIVSTALDEYPDLWGTSDREVLHALEKYKLEQEFNTTDEMDLNQIIEEGKNLDKLFQQEEESDDL